MQQLLLNNYHNGSAPASKESMQLFKDWLNNSLFIAPHPSFKQDGIELVCLCDIVLNVSDLMDFKLNKKLTALGVQTFWFPFGESFGFPLENIFGAMMVLWYAEQQNKRVFLHCIAGRNRSVAVADCYYFLRSGEHRADNSPNILYGKNKDNQLLQNIYDNQLPGIFRMEQFLEKCQKLLGNPSIAERLCRLVKKRILILLNSILQMRNKLILPKDLKR